MLVTYSKDSHLHALDRFPIIPSIYQMAASYPVVVQTSIGHPMNK